MNDRFEDDEKMYRAIEGRFIKGDGSVSSAAFKGNRGCSVDRGDYRTDEEASSFLLNHLRGSAYSIIVLDCRQKEIYIAYEPSTNNQYHSALYQNHELHDMTQSQCKHLATVAKKVK